MSVTPRPASSVILLRDAEGGLEILFVRRAKELKFMGGAWVFPGGGLHEEDGDAESELAWQTAGARETWEEARIKIAEPADLVPFSRWITPELAPMRFDTRFYVGIAPADSEPHPDRREVDRAEWWTPAKALDLYVSDEAELHFPTIKQVEQINEFERAEDVLAAHRGREVEPILPRVAASEDGFEILLPGDAGYEAAAPKP